MSYKFFNNNKCEYFPCHETNDKENFNCLFCYCPLYALGKNCGGNPIFLDNNIKDCSSCYLPHDPKSYDFINSKYSEILEISKKNS